jgi:hypothetical protein
MVLMGVWLRLLLCTVWQHQVGEKSVPTKQNCKFLVQQAKERRKVS